MDKSPDTPTSLNTTVAALGGVIVGALGFATAVAGGWFTYAGKDQELKVHLVEIAVSILRADPKEDVGAPEGGPWTSWSEIRACRSAQMTARPFYTNR